MVDSDYLKRGLRRYDLHWLQFLLTLCGYTHKHTIEPIADCFTADDVRQALVDNYIDFKSGARAKCDNTYKFERICNNIIENEKIIDMRNRKEGK